MESLPQTCRNWISVNSPALGRTPPKLEASRPVVSKTITFRDPASATPHHPAVGENLHSLDTFKGDLIFGDSGRVPGLLLKVPGRSDHYERSAIDPPPTFFLPNHGGVFCDSNASAITEDPTGG